MPKTTEEQACLEAVKRMDEKIKEINVSSNIFDDKSKETKCLISDFTNSQQTLIEKIGSMKFPHKFAKEGMEFKEKLYLYTRKIIDFCVY